jgi:tetratricopeptide (TPR) repeat protein
LIDAESLGFQDVNHHVTREVTHMQRAKVRLVFILVPLVAAGCGFGPAPNHAPAAADVSVVQRKLQNEPASPLNASDVAVLLTSDHYELLDHYFSGVQRDYVEGKISDETLRNAFRAFYDTSSVLEPKYDVWVRQYPQSYVARLARGIYYKKMGQARRGTDFIDNTSLMQLAGMELAYHRALADFRASENLDKRPLLTYMHMMDVSSQAGDLAANRAILDAAIRVDPTNFVVRQKYMISLEPRWGGSREQMKGFLEECRNAQLNAATLRRLEAVIVGDQAQAEYDSKNYGAATPGYRTALDMGAETICWECAAYAASDQKQYADAIKFYSMMLQDSPSDAATLARRAYAYSQLEDPKALDDFTAAANLGDAYAQNELGKYNLYGVPGLVPQNRERAIDWFRKAAAHGDPDGKRNLAAALSGK